MIPLFEQIANLKLTSHKEILNQVETSIKHDDLIKGNGSI